ncbi:MAG: ATP-binding protein [Deltaproteobacteria bacterium]|nr:ATP-binding protein [Deltaproteobacteria bacterium]
MKRFFNTAGPVKYKNHYCLPPLERLNLAEVLSLIDQEKYFVLHAPRQTGKTSCLLALMEYLNRQGLYECLYVNVEIAQSARENVHRGIKGILNEISERARIYLQNDRIQRIWPEILSVSGEEGALNTVLTRWAEESPKPIVLLMDEIDALIGDTLISVLRQLRSGYDKRPLHFPQSIILCGVRDVRDYRIHSDKEKAIITGGSAFNIKTKSLRLGEFSREEMNRLYQQHTDETAQTFLPETLDLAWEYTSGQPWIVNALGYEVCFEMKEGQIRENPITPEMMTQAKESLIIRRETHLDQLMDKLQEERVIRVLGPILEGKALSQSFQKDDIGYVLDLGLIRQATNGEIQLSNRIYQEIIPRELVWNIQSGMTEKASWYIRENGLLDMKKLLSAFQDFFQEHSEHWIERFEYKEAGPQLLIQAFLQRIVNGGGRIEREYGLGRMRTDLLVIWPVKGKIADGEQQTIEDIRHPVKSQRVVIELKILYKSLEKTIDAGLKQTWEYMDRCRADEGHLVVFDRSPKKSWKKKRFVMEKNFQEHSITVWGM